MSENEHVYRGVPFSVGFNGSTWGVTMQISAGVAGIGGYDSEEAAIEGAKKHIDHVLDDMSRKLRSSDDENGDSANS